MRITYELYCACAQSDPFKMPTVEIPEGTETGCVIEECVEGYWNATGQVHPPSISQALPSCICCLCACLTAGVVFSRFPWTDWRSLMLLPLRPGFRAVRVYGAKGPVCHRDMHERSLPGSLQRH